ncbi:hypothetical protein WT27_21265 [Burkholderia territorii]|uniref:Uncharacterized protein n=2 Tax=Burkholderia territorii TaxID=1503055 RepID=A0A106EL64_9BURK|nr:hypothetical protein WT27_21265 [Burkholderia territorii]KVX49746.1 hypothetical protein WT31_19165 [Burkholderia territorii]
MRNVLRQATVAGITFCICATSLAFDCTDSMSYRNGRNELALVRQATAAQLGIAVEFIRKRDDVDFDTALKQVMQMIPSSETQQFDARLAAIGAQIRDAPADSSQACAALLTLQRQYSHTSQQKIDFIVKRVTGASSEPQPAP